jgi:molybdate transport system permease protein
LSPIALSLLVATLGAVLGSAPAIALGWLLARREFRGKSLVTALVLAPLVLPPVVTGLLLLRVLGRRGLLGPALDAIGLAVPFTTVGAVVAGLAVGLPLYVVSARTAFEAVDRRLEEVAASFGLAPRAVFFRVSLPLATPGLLAGFVLAFARALGEFGATAVLAGDAPGRTRTIALAVYAALEAPGHDAQAMELALASVAMSLVALVVHEVFLRRHRAKLGLS